MHSPDRQRVYLLMDLNDLFSEDPTIIHIKWPESKIRLSSGAKEEQVKSETDGLLVVVPGQLHFWGEELKGKEHYAQICLVWNPNFESKF